MKSWTRRYILFLVFNFITISFSFGQKEHYVWYFGHNLGLDFNHTPPLLLKDGKQEQLEGTSSISDSTGNLLFYSDGVSAWSSENKLQGFWLKGHNTSTQSALFVKQPGNTGTYYLFTTYAGQYFNLNIYYGLNYVRLNECVFDSDINYINSSSIQLLENSTEKVAAVNHANDTDVWVMGHEFATNRFFAYLLTEEGLADEPVISESGSSINDSDDYYYGWESSGYLKFSPDGSKIAMATYHRKGFVEVFDFNNETGEVSNPRTIDFDAPYGVEFSPDMTKLYVARQSVFYLTDFRVFQYDLTTTTDEELKASEKLVYSFVARVTAGALQLAPDYTLYMSHLAKIVNPDAAAEDLIIDSTLVDEDDYEKVMFGLPNHNASYYDQDPYIIYYKQEVCSGTSVDFRIDNNDNVASVNWDFGEPDSNNNLSAENMPSHTYGDYGKYLVKATLTMNDGSELIKYKKVVLESLVMNKDYLKDTTVCDKVWFGALATDYGSACFSWSTGLNHDRIWIQEPGWYWVDVTKLGCTVRDSFYVELIKTPELALDENLEICEGDEYILDAGMANAKNYSWSTGETTSSIKIDSQGYYTVEASNGICIDSGFVNVTSERYPEFYIPGDTAFCEGSSVDIFLNDPAADFIWNTGDETDILSIDAPGKYWVQSNIDYCAKTDTLIVEEIQYPDVLMFDTLICSSDNLLLDYPVPESNYLWTTGLNNPELWVSEAGTYSVNISNKCFDETIYFNVSTENCDCEIFIPNVFTPNGDGKNEVFQPVLHQKVINLQMFVFDRWGKEVFSSAGLNSRWTGQIDQELINPGVYYYSLKYQCIDANDDPLWYNSKGYIQMIW